VPDIPELETRPLAAAGGDGWLLAGRYRMLERVGAGGMAEVFRAHDELLDRDVAVKVFRTELQDPDSALNAETRRELELQAMARLNHPNLVTLFDGSVRGGGPPYLVLEYVPGPNLAARLREGPLPEPAVRTLGEQVAEGLAYVHAQGLVHRDVKPANILLSAADGRARLSDFGVVRMVGRPQVTSAELTIGTAYYLAPEQARGSAVGPEADVYALGLVLLEALTGRRCFDGPLAEALALRLTADPEIPADLPAPWPGLLTAMTARDPSGRPSAAAVAGELRSSDVAPPVPVPVSPGPASTALPVAAETYSAPMVASAVAPAPPSLLSGPADVPPRRRGRAGLLGGLAAAAVAAIAVGVAYLMPGDSKTPAGTTPTTSTTSSTKSAAKHPVTTVRHDTGVPAAAVVPASGGKKASKKPGRHHHGASAKSTPSRGPAGGPPPPTAPTTSASSSSAPASSSAPSSAPPGSSAPPTDPPPSSSAAAQGAAAPPTTSPAGP